MDYPLLVSLIWWLFEWYVNKNFYNKHIIAFGNHLKFYHMTVSCVMLSYLIHKKKSTLLLIKIMKA